MKDLLESDQELTLAFSKTHDGDYHSANLMVKLPGSDEYVNIETNPENVLEHNGLGKTADHVFPVNINRSESDFLEGTKAVGPCLLSITETLTASKIHKIALKKSDFGQLELDRAYTTVEGGGVNRGAVRKAESCIRKAKVLKAANALLIVDAIATPIIHF